jgi:hypothetical protein
MPNENESPRDPARDPQDLERLLVARQHAGDVEGMMALYEPPRPSSTAATERRCAARTPSGRTLPARWRRAGNSPSASSARP